MKKVLVVDDSALMRRVLSDIINKDEEFHTEHSARDGLEALKLMEQNDFDAIVLDIIMPRMNGLIFLRRSMKEVIPPKSLLSVPLPEREPAKRLRLLNWEHSTL